jgi:hypothetical protein
MYEIRQIKIVTLSNEQNVVKYIRKHVNYSHNGRSKKNSVIITILKKWILKVTLSPFANEAQYWRIEMILNKIVSTYV